MTLVLGIDEAGRGPVIGPMVIAGIIVEEKSRAKLKSIGVKDSKLLSPKKREYLEKEIKKIVHDYIILKVPAKEIDRLRERINLNLIEAKKIAEIIKLAKADIAYVDSPQVSTDKFKNILIAQANNNTKIICENYADKNYEVCAAASILAKQERDRDIEKIKKKVGVDFGVGYPHDERTIKHLEELAEKGDYPDYVRKSWVTAQDIMGKSKQKSIFDY